MEELKKTKVCSCCKIEKPLEEFDICRKNKDGRQCKCKECRKIYRQQNKDKIRESKKRYAEENKEKLKEKHKKYYEENKGEILVKYKEYRDSHKEEIRECRQEYYQENKEKVKEKVKKYASDNRETINQKNREYYQENKERLNQANKEYQQKNKEKIAEYQKKYSIENKEKIQKKKKEYQEKNKDRLREYRKEYLKDPIRKQKANMRSFIWGCYNRMGYKKNKRTYDIIGLQPEEFKEYLENTFFNNYGYKYNGEDIHIDHITPLATATTIKEVEKLCYYTNLQMLKPEDNLEKGKKLDWSLDEKREENKEGKKE